MYSDRIRCGMCNRSGPRPSPKVLSGSQLSSYATLQKVQASKFCQDHDLVDPITLLIATGLRRSELLGLRWIDYDDEARTLAVTGKVVRASGEGLQRVDETKSAAGRRRVPVPQFAVEFASNPPAPVVPGRARSDLPVHGGNAARPE
jgi:integrase